MTEAKHYLEEHGIKPSQQRLAIMRYLMSQKTHPTADDIYTNLVEQIPTLSKATVYNTLGLLTANKAIWALTINGDTTRYDGDTQAHAHFLCNECGRITDVALTGTRFFEKNKPKDMRIDEVQLYYKGVCSECMEKQKQTNNL